MPVIRVLGHLRFADLAGAAAHTVTLVGIALIYFILAKFGLMLASVNPSATPIWPPTGFALAAVLLWGNRIAPAILIGAFIANATTAGSLATSVAIAVGNSLEAVVGAWLINEWSDGRSTFATPVGVAKFALIAFAPSTMISATIGVVTLGLAGYAEWAKFSSIWVTWWLGDLTGALVFTPFIVLWANRDTRTLVRADWIESTMVFLAAVAVGLFAFGPLLGPKVYRDPLGFLAVVPLLWAALRGSQRDTATISLVLSAIAVWGTYEGSGPFSGLVVDESFLLLLMFVISVSVPTLALSADVAQRRLTEHELLASRPRGT